MDHPARGVSVQQKFLEPSGDYRLAKYSNIQLNKKINGDVFKLKTNKQNEVRETEWVRELLQLEAVSYQPSAISRNKAGGRVAQSIFLGRRGDLVMTNS